jgi:hypothetical protein
MRDGFSNLKRLMASRQVLNQTSLKPFSARALLAASAPLAPRQRLMRISQLPMIR